MIQTEYMYQWRTLVISSPSVITLSLCQFTICVETVYSNLLLHYTLVLSS